jgi:hypothetical protein
LPALPKLSETRAISEESTRSFPNEETEDITINPFKMPTDSEIFEMRDEDKRIKEEVYKLSFCREMMTNQPFEKKRQAMMSKKIYDKHTPKKTYKTLIANDSEDEEFFEKLRKRELDKISTTKRGTFLSFHKNYL